ncbi:hypothetical protein AJ88_01760 [Mesorhizobium amorphae CCBAU 01583]|nr:hypothetical protein AJ88_01760 [Mesorhizobium amorphae CCBAU 01583]
MLNGALFAVSAVIMAVNILFYHDAMVAAIIARNESQGRSITLEAAERAVALSPYGFALLGAMAAILYFCRERAAASVAKSLDRPLDSSS